MGNVYSQVQSLELLLPSAIIIMIIAGVLALIRARRKGLSDFRIRALPRGDSRMVRLAALFLELSSITGLFWSPSPALASIKPSIPAVVALALTGVLLFFCKKRPWLPYAAAVVLTVAVGAFYTDVMPGVPLLMISLSGFLMLLSMIGWQHNVVFKFLPQSLALPVLNLLSMALVLFFIPATARGLEPYIVRADMPPVLAYIYALVRLLPLVGILLVNMASEAHRIELSVSKICTRATPKGGMLFTVASWLLLACGAANTLVTLFRAYDASALLLTLPLLAVGLLLVFGKGSERSFIMASVCLVLSIAVRFFNAVSNTMPTFWTYTFPVLLMLVSAIGALKNRAVPFLSKVLRAPILNVIAAVLLLVGILVNIGDLSEYSAAASKAREQREPALIKIAANAGKAIASVSYYMEVVGESVAAFDETVVAFETALKNARELMDEEKADEHTATVEDAVAAAREAEVLAADACAELDVFILAFKADLSAISKEARAEFETAASSGNGQLGGLKPPAANALDSAADDASEETNTDPAAAVEAALEAVLDQKRMVVSVASYIAKLAEGTLADIEKISASVGSAAEAVRQENARLYSLAFGIMAALGLALLNLSLDSREVAQWGLFAAFLQICRRVFSWFYRDVGGKLKVLAKLQALLFMVVACLSAIVAAVGLCGFLITFFFVGFGFENLTIFLMGIGGILASFILALPTWFLYAFGQITADMHEVKENGAMAAPDYLEENPDDLPEL